MYYKMKAILLLALSAIILSQSYGFAYGAVDVDGNPISVSNTDVATVSVTTDSSSYLEGEMISVSGSVSDYNESDVNMQHDITLTFLNPKNSFIGVEQSPLNSDGSYSVDVEAVESWLTFEGDYTVTVCNGKDRCASTTFTFIHSESEEGAIEEDTEEVTESIEISEEELAEKCGEGTHLVDGVCMLDESSEAETVSANTGSVPTEGFNSWIYSITFTLLIAFVIAIILFLISRVRGKKTV